MESSPCFRQPFAFDGVFDLDRLAHCDVARPYGHYSPCGQLRVQLRSPGKPWHLTSSTMSSASGAGRSQQRSKSRSAGSGRSNSESVTVFLRLRPTPTPGATSLFEVADDSKSVTLHAPIGAGAAHESRINAASPATAMKLTFGLGRTPSKIK